MLSTYSPQQLSIFTELKSAYKKRNIRVIPDIWNFNIISNLCYFYFDVLFFSSLSFILCLFMWERLKYSLVFLLACSSFSSKWFHHSTKMKSSWEMNMNANKKLLFCVFQRNLHQSSLFRFLFFLNESVSIGGMNLLHISALSHLHFQMFSNLTFHFEHKYSL